MCGVSEILVDFIEKLPEVNKPVVAAMINEISDRAYEKLGECIRDNTTVPEYLQIYVDWIFTSIGAKEFTWDNCTKEVEETRFEFQ